ncbi:hypothetical protein Mgra_00000721 [Meloidogyne graminicola]|uniref:NADH dehydrogenase [ubiquinone] 1 beta subcomplex subunit 7 n=1 Tax=Meloidogyne graminicola TaxID=189291 RepID=A0A8T0A168_9BILA|nr:hypothetical protein Mgra_00000721 [Meloidogyne graminicola]
MGGKISRNVEDYFDPLCTPRNDRPSTFDPLYGFPKGRKPREMKITWEEMEKAALPVGLRDYCAHLAIPYMKCQNDHRPFAAHHCNGVYHNWAHCEHEDHMIRIKEYERERRLLKRKLRKERLAGEQKAAQS